MPDSNQPDAVVAAIRSAATWDERVARIRRIPEDFGVARHKDVYGRIAAEIYVPALGPDFAYVHWREEYELTPFRSAYETALEATNGFSEALQAEGARLGGVACDGRVFTPATLDELMNVQPLPALISAWRDASRWC